MVYVAILFNGGGGFFVCVGGGFCVNDGGWIFCLLCGWVFEFMVVVGFFVECWWWVICLL